MISDRAILTSIVAGQLYAAVLSRGPQQDGWATHAASIAADGADRIIDEVMRRHPADQEPDPA